MAEGAERFRGLWEDEMFARQRPYRVPVNTWLPEVSTQFVTTKRKRKCVGRRDVCSSARAHIAPWNQKSRHIRTRLEGSILKTPTHTHAQQFVPECRESRPKRERSKSDPGSLA